MLATSRKRRPPHYERPKLCVLVRELIFNVKTFDVQCSDCEYLQAGGTLSVYILEEKGIGEEYSIVGVVSDKETARFFRLKHPALRRFTQRYLDNATLLNRLIEEQKPPAFPEFSGDIKLVDQETSDYAALQDFLVVNQDLHRSGIDMIVEDTDEIKNRNRT